MEIGNDDSDRGPLPPPPSTSIASRSSTLVNAFESLIIPLCSSIEQV